MTPPRKFDAVCFDCDSTLSRVEGIDELAARAGCKAEIAALTEAAMNGEVALDDVYGARLERVRPDRAALDWLAERYIDETVDGASEAIATLQRLGKSVYVVSGGLRQSVVQFARTLGVDAAHVFAVDVFFDRSGAYARFDHASPLARNDGKAVVCRAIGELQGAVALVGDGVTDLAARAGGAYIVGYGGVAHREAVKAAADAYVATQSLTAVLDAVLTDDEKGRI